MRWRAGLCTHKSWRHSLARLEIDGLDAEVTPHTIQERVPPIHKVFGAHKEQLVLRERAEPILDEGRVDSTDQLVGMEEDCEGMGRAGVHPEVREVGMWAAGAMPLCSLPSFDGS